MLMCTALPRTPSRPSRHTSDLQPLRLLTVHYSYVSDPSLGLPFKGQPCLQIDSRSSSGLSCKPGISWCVRDLLAVYSMWFLTLFFERAIISLLCMRYTEPGRFCLHLRDLGNMFQVDVELNTMVLICIYIYIYLQICQSYLWDLQVCYFAAPIFVLSFCQI